MANLEQVQNRSDRASRLFSELEKYLDCAENFYNYGVEMSYFTLKDAGFTIKETDIAESIWAKEREKQNIIVEKKKQEKKQTLLKRIEANDIFTTCYQFSPILKLILQK